MNRLLAALTAVCGLVAASPASHAATITPDLSTAVFTGGTGNSEAQISNITVTPVAVPGSIAGTGIPALLGLVGLWAARRGRQKLAPL
jgi:hypothetical protein